MPRNLIYYIALLLPLVLRVALFNTPLVEWLAANGHVQLAQSLSDFGMSPKFVGIVGDWTFPIFALACFGYWVSLEDGENVPAQFMLVPLIYLPFSLIDSVFANGGFDLQTLYAHALIVLPVGYVYILPWALVAYWLGKSDLVV